jgi:hypothetical protein
MEIEKGGEERAKGGDPEKERAILIIAKEESDS